MSNSASRQGIVAFAFGVPSTIKSNRIIADIASEYSNWSGGLPIFTQTDIQFDGSAPFPVTYTEEQPGKPPSTLRFAREAIAWAKVHDLDEFKVACAAPHAWRCLRDLQRAAREAGVSIVINVLPWVHRMNYENWFDPQSTQPRTRSRQAWEKRERILKLMPFWMYKFVAS